MKVRRSYILVLAIFLLALIPIRQVWSAVPDESPSRQGAQEGPSVQINEIRIDQPGGEDPDEYFELMGTPELSLDGYTYLVIGDGVGGSGVIESVVDLSGESIPASGYFVAAESTFTLVTATMTTTLNFENSDNVTHLLVQNFTGADGDDLDTDDDGILDVTPWDNLVDLIALIEEDNPPSGTEYHYGPPTVGPDGDFVPGHVFRCEGDWEIGDFGGSDDTPGAENDCGPVVVDPGVCGDPATLIHAIQGAGSTSPLVSTIQTIEGIVVGDFQNNEEPDSGNLNGFYVQEEDADTDADPLTSEGIFVYAPGAVDVAEGDVVRVTGTVEEYQSSGSSMTQLSDVSDLQECGTADLPAPADITLPVDDLSDFEPYEGMLVRFPQELVISEFFNFDRFNETVLTLPMPGEQRHWQPTAIDEPGSPEAAARLDYNRRSRITLDDGRSSQNPDPAIHPNGEEFTLDNRFRGGDVVSGTTGLLDESFGLYRVQPTRGAAYTVRNPRPEEPDVVSGTLRVAAFNVLNYFTTIDEGEDICGPDQNQECRGADTPEELERQRAKIVAALAEIDADIVGLIELENGPTDAALADLVAGLNDAVGAGTYEYIPTGPIGTDAIKVALIYKGTTVMPIGDYAILDSSVDPRFADDLNRPVLAQTFREIATNGRLTVAVNHLKSKGSGCGPGDDDPEQGNCNGTRTDAAEALVDWLASDPTNSQDPDYLIIGDLNSYDKEDPIDAIIEGADDTTSTEDDYVDLIARHQGEFAYSYLFDSQLGYLDHALANQALTAQVTGAAFWHINADEPDILDYDMSFKQDPQDALFEPNEFRSSDHDPVIVGLNLEPSTFGMRLPLFMK